MFLFCCAFAIVVLAEAAPGLFAIPRGQTAGAEVVFKEWMQEVGSRMEFLFSIPQRSIKCLDYSLFNVGDALVASKLLLQRL